MTDGVGLDRDVWPSGFPVSADGRVEHGLVVWSLPVDVAGHVGRVEGRTTGGRTPCACPTCGGWFIGVKWETGQQMFICSRGWSYDPLTGSISITLGSGLSTTVANDRPNTRSAARPRSQWPDRSDLGPTWRHTPTSRQGEGS
jgi:hypothetical protein